MSPATPVDQHGVYLLFMAGVLVLVVVLAAAAALEALADRSRRHEAPPAAFTCPDCGARSWHPEDGRQGYCARCRAFTGRPAGLDIPTDHRRTA